MLYRFIFKILKELAETQQDLEITRSSNMTILTLLLEKKICSKEEYVSTFNEIQSKNMENIKDILNTDTAIINCGAYGKGRIYNLEMSVENESNS